MKLWEIIKACAEGGYVGGEMFYSNTGQTLLFDGQRLMSIEKADLDDEWFYIDKKRPQARGN